MNTEVDRKIAILVADVVGYSKHMERDENATLKAYAECEKLLKTVSRNTKDLSLIQRDSALAEFQVRLMPLSVVLLSKMTLRKEMNR